MIPVALLTVFLVANLLEQDVVAHTPGQPECGQFNSFPRKQVDLNPLGPAQRKQILNTLLACYSVDSNVDIDGIYFRIKDWFDWQLSGIEVATLLGLNDIARSFIHDGANVNSIAIHFAAWKGNINMLRILLDLGADVNWKDSLLKRPPMYYAVVYGQTEAAALLIERGYDVNKIMIGYTPLMLAAVHAQYDMVALLMRKGARKDLRDTWGRTAESYALELRKSIPRSAASYSKVINLLRNSKGK